MAGQGILIVIIPNDLQPSEPTEAPHAAEYPCEACGSSLISRFRHHISSNWNLIDALWIPSEDRQHFFIICSAELGQHSDVILEQLRRAEIGIRPGSKVFILPLSCALGIDYLASSSTPTMVEIKGPTDEEKEPTSEETEKSKSEFKRSIRARLTVLQVVNAIRGQTLFSFDFLLLTILASIIALLGLLEDNPVILVASMLVSPLMGPILGIVFGLCVGDANLWKVGLKTEAIGLLVTILTGFVVGLCTTWSETHWGSSRSFPTDEMRSRGDIRRLWSGALVALPSGAGAALSVLGGNVGSLVGVAISASLLPPAVNAGLLCSYSLLSALIPSIGKHVPIESLALNGSSLPSIARNCTKFVANDYIPIYSCHMAIETGLLGICSFVLTVTNIVCIIVMAMVILRVKEVVPIVRDDEIAEFWHDDVRIVRGQNKAMRQREAHNFVQLWETMEKPEHGEEQHRPLKGRNRLEMELARKVRNLRDFARGYNLDLSKLEDRLLQTEAARGNLQRMVQDMSTSIDETNQLNLGSLVASVGRHQQRSKTRSRMQTFYQELLDVMPVKWRDVFEQCQA